MLQYHVFFSDTNTNTKTSIGIDLYQYPSNIVFFKNELALKMFFNWSSPQLISFSQKSHTL